jgi:hypothetical protein
MPLSRLENFLKNPQGNLIYVDSTSFDSTDSYDNQGNSLPRPFSSIQRAAIEAARFSYQNGRSNDKIDKTTIIVYPGTYYIDNRPGYSIQKSGNSAVFKRRTGATTWSTTSTLPEFSASSNFDILDSNNDLYKFNSVLGGVILPRGTSIIGLDLRKTKIRPLYVPNPEDDTIDYSSIFNVTGTCYFTAFTFFDADNTKIAYKDYSSSTYVPNYSHHKLSAFAYADGVNKVALGYDQTDLTDLDMYYYKVSYAYGDLTGRALTKYPNGLDFETSTNEYRIVGDIQTNPLGISSIRSGNGNGTGSLTTITVTTKDLTTGNPKEHGLLVDSPVLISGITTNASAYNGSFTVKDVVGLTTFAYTSIATPTNFLPLSNYLTTATAVVESDTVNSASPYVFNCSLRSTWGMSGLWADGNRASGFRSMVVAQFTGVSLQKDDNAFLLYDNGTYYDNYTLPADSVYRPLHTNSNAIYKPKYENFHVRASNNAFIQCVSVFGIGYARQFLTESGGDMSITNSNSNFGSISLESSGFRNESFDRDDVGYITHIIPPKENDADLITVSWLSLDGQKIISAANTERLYISDYTKSDVKPYYQVDGYRVGAKVGGTLNLIVGTGNTVYTTPILMPVPSGIGTSAKKIYDVGRSSVGINSISSNIITLTTSHQLFNGESVRVFSDTGQVPDGLENDKIYCAITTGLSSNQIKLALSLGDAASNNSITGINALGGRLTIVSSVSDKASGDLGHPIQYDSGVNSWYIVGSASSVTNQIYSAIVSTGLSTRTNNTYITRVSDTRSNDDKIYRIRYVIPKEYTNARPPQPGYVLQESKSVGVTTISFTSDDISNTIDLKNIKIIAGITSGAIVNNSQTVTVTTELPHNFVVGDKVKIQKVLSTNNTSGTGITSTFNGSYFINSVRSSRRFTYVISGVSTNPGVFINNNRLRSTTLQRDALPLVSREQYSNTFYVYKVNTVRKHIPGASGRDGVYILTVLSSGVSPDSNVGYGLSAKKFNQDVKNLYPQIDRDNYNFDPSASTTYAEQSKIGKVTTNDKKKSITKEAVNVLVKNTRIGFGITAITGIGGTTITLYTDVEHKLNSIKSVAFGVGFGTYAVNSTYYGVEMDGVNPEESATCNFTTDASGFIIPSSLTIADPGSDHDLGEELGIIGASFGSPNTVVTVSEINNNIGDGLELSGFNQSELNGVFRIVDIPNKKSVSISVPNGISTYAANTNGYIPSAYIVSNAIGITSFAFASTTTGIVTVTTSVPHSLLVGNKFTIVGSGHTIYDNSFIVKSIVGINTFSFNIGIVTETKSSTTGVIFKRQFTSNALNLGTNEENLGSRASYIYAGISTAITSNITSTTTTIGLTSTSGFNRGDYVILNAEILRLSSIPASGQFKVLRAQFGTYATSAVSGSIIKKIKVLPVELRRPSYLRASGHTFEYVGYGPGNYSNSLPQKQTKVLSEDDVILSQSRKTSGGSVSYSGMNDLGEVYSGAKKSILNTGEDKIIDAPVITFTGDDALNSNEYQRSVGSFDEVTVRDRITVNGGDNNDQSSQFYGPVNFTKKLTNNSNEGIEVKNLFIKGTTQTKRITVDDVTNPSIGNISLVSLPNSGYIGNVYTSNGLRPFGLISNSSSLLSFNVDKIGVGVDISSASGIGLSVATSTVLNNLTVTGTVLFTQPQILGNVNLGNITSSGTAILGVTSTTNLTAQTLNVTGISTLSSVLITNGLTLNSNIVSTGASIGNIRIGIANSNTINTTIGGLVLDSNIGITTISDDVDIRGSLSVTSGSILTRISDNSRGLEIGIGNTNSYSYIDLHNDDTVYPDYGLRIIRGTGSGDVNSKILHRGTSSLQLKTEDLADIRLFTNNIERFKITSYGLVSIVDNSNGGTSSLGAHLRILQSYNPSSGDSIISWDNSGQKNWYAGIDASDNYSWKLASPATYSLGNENFDAIDIINSSNNETKLKVDSSGNLKILGSLSSLIGTLNLGSTSYDSIVSGSNIRFQSNGGASINLYGPTGGLPNNAYYDAETHNFRTVTSGAGTAVNINGGLVNFGSIGSNPPAFTSRSAGTKIILYSNIGASSVDYGLGIDSNTLWSSIPTSAQQFKWYAGTTSIATLFGDGTLSINGALNSQSLNVSNGSITCGTITAAAGASNGFRFPNNAFGGTGDTATITLQNPSGGEVSRMTFTLTNDANDVFSFNAPSINGMLMNDNVVLNAGNYGSYSTFSGAISGTSLTVTGDVTAFYSSDRRLKDNIKPIENALAKLFTLSGNTFEWNDKSAHTGTDVGVIAQEVQKVLPEVVTQRDNGYLAVRYEKLVPLLIESIKELTERVNKLEGNK